MGLRFPISRHTLMALAVFRLLAGVGAVNVTEILSSFPDFSGFDRLLQSTPVAAEIAGRSSVTLLAVPNSYLFRSDVARSAADISDVLRYHVLLEYLTWQDLKRIPRSGQIVATLYQTTGRAAENSGEVNLTCGSDGGVAVRPPEPYSPSNATVLAPVVTLPYNISVLAVDALLVPYGSELEASEARPGPPVNITWALVNGKDFNVAAAMLTASGVVDEFEVDERGAGITVFVPSDEAFAALPSSESLQSLPAGVKATVLRFHVLHCYYPLGSLESIVNPVQPTVATEDTGAGRFTLNITRLNGSVAIDTGLVQASITRTVIDQNPVAIFAVSKVLLPEEIFGKLSRGAAGAVGLAAAAPPFPEIAPSGSDSDDNLSSSRLSSPPGRKDDVVNSTVRRTFAAVPSIFCILVLVYLL